MIRTVLESDIVVEVRDEQEDAMFPNAASSNKYCKFHCLGPFAVDGIGRSSLLNAVLASSLLLYNRRTERKVFAVTDMSQIAVCDITVLHSAIRSHLGTGRLCREPIEVH